MLRLLCLLAVLIALPAHAGNRLAGHPVPYLALHGQDATDWREWGPAVFAEARRSGKLVMVSLGYFACHWCHVMQRETWADAEAARVINRHFIPVKVDREVQAALDANLQAFAELTRGRSGWPLTVFLTPAGDPLFALLYAPRAEFVAVAEALARRWEQDGAGLTRLAKAAARPPVQPAPARLPEDFLRAAMSSADPLQGGFGDGAKFPMVSQLQALLAFERHRPDPVRRGFLKTTLEQMRARALRDHVAGGFFRYTVDPGWEEPHFEKMLYDNAQLATLYLDAARVLDEPAYLAVARETLDFMLAELQSGAAFSASLSAVDGKGEEGGAYLWSVEALRRVLPAEVYAPASRVWGLDQAGPFASGYLPHERRAPEAHERPALAVALRALKSARAGREIPRDDKLLAGWNGLALAALARGAGLDRRYREAADALFAFARDRFLTGAGMVKGYAGGQALGPGELEDYALLAHGLNEYAAATGSKPARALAVRLLGQAWRRFHGPGGLRLEARPLIAGAASPWEDGAIPAPAVVLLALTLEVGDAGLKKRALGELRRARAQAYADPFGYAGLARLLPAGFTRPLPRGRGAWPGASPP